MITVQTVTYRFKYSEEHECCGDSGYQFPQQTQKTTGHRVYDGLKQKNILILHIYVILFFSMFIFRFRKHLEIGFTSLFFSANNKLNYLSTQVNIKILK